MLRSPYTSAIIDTYQQNGRISSESKRLQHPSEQKIRRKTWMKIDIRKICELEQKILSYAPSKKHDKFAIETIKEAIKAAKARTFGVGAILVHKETGTIMYRGHNKVFSEFRSDLHAEMDVLDSFEAKNKENSRKRIKEFTMYTSLESCPMCLCRIITAGLIEVYHVADDNNGGMIHLYDQLPSIWKDISKKCIFKKADCSDDLSTIAEQVFLLSSPKTK